MHSSNAVNGRVYDERERMIIDLSGDLTHIECCCCRKIVPVNNTELHGDYRVSRRMSNGWLWVPGYWYCNKCAKDWTDCVCCGQVTDYPDAICEECRTQAADGMLIKDLQ